MGHVDGVQQHGAPVTITQAMIITMSARITLSKGDTLAISDLAKVTGAGKVKGGFGSEGLHGHGRGRCHWNDLSDGRAIAKVER